MLTEQPAVQDLMALADALLLPQDDLTFACLLTSPLGGLSDDSLMDLAIGRSGPLWEALRARAEERPDWQAAWAFFAALLARVDYVSPHALFAEALGPLGGRARLFARLGPEAAEPVDELLNAALAYGRMHPPSLQGFLHWLRRSGAEVKREAEGAGSLVRVMTVHGAKGLQAPLVILPDTTSLPPDEGSILWATDPATGRDVPIWSPRREVRCAAAQRLRDAAKQRRMEEHNRLLYVALTRAEDRLLVCGWQTRRGLDDACWYRLVERGFDALPAEREAFDGWDGEQRRHATPQIAEPDADRQARQRSFRSPTCRAGPARRPIGAPPPRPPNRAGRNGWLRAGRRMSSLGRCRPPPRRWRRARRRTTGSVAARWSTRCCSTCPTCRRDRRAAAALAWLDRPGNGLAAGEAETLAARDAGDPRPSRACAAVRAGQPRRGAADRHWSTGRWSAGWWIGWRCWTDRVLVADYKTNRRPPTRDRGHAGAVPAPDGRLPRGAARHLPGSRHRLRAGLDPDVAGRHAAG